MERLKEEGFAFRSEAGAKLLARAAANMTSHEDEAIAALMRLGAKPGSDVLEQALQLQRVAPVEQLLAQNALGAEGRRNQARIDAAFRAAIAGGHSTWCSASGQFVAPGRTRRPDTGRATTGCASWSG